MNYTEAARARRHFLRLFAETGNANQACRLAGVARSAIQTRKQKDPQFAEHYRAAMAVARATRQRVGAAYDATIGAWRMIDPYERPTQVPPTDVAYAIEPLLPLLIYVPDRYGAPEISPCESFTQAELKAYWRAAPTPYPTCRRDFWQLTGDDGMDRFEVRYTAARIRTWYVMSDNPFAEIDLGTGYGECTYMRSLFARPEIARRCDLDIASWMADADRLLLLDAAIAGRPKAAPREATASGDAEIATA